MKVEIVVKVLESSFSYIALAEQETIITSKHVEKLDIGVLANNMLLDVIEEALAVLGEAEAPDAEEE